MTLRARLPGKATLPADAAECSRPPRDEGRRRHVAHHLQPLGACPIPKPKLVGNACVVCGSSVDGRATRSPSTLRSAHFATPAKIQSRKICTSATAVSDAAAGHEVSEARDEHSSLIREACVCRNLEEQELAAGG